MRKAMLITAAAIMIMPAPAAAQGVNAAASRRVSVEVREDGRVVATTNVRLQLGRQAAVTMNGPYAMRLRVDAAEGGAYTVRPNLQPNGPGPALVSPPLTVPEGQEGSAIVSRPSGPRLEVAVRVE